MIQGYPLPSLYRPDLVQIPQIIRVHSLPEADGPLPPASLLWFKLLSTRPTFHPSSSRRPSQDALHPLLCFHTGFSRRSHLIRDTPFPSAAVLSQESASQTQPPRRHQPASWQCGSPSPQVVPFSLQQESVRPPPALPVPRLQHPRGYHFQTGRKAGRGAGHRGSGTSRFSGAPAAPPARASAPVLAPPPSHSTIPTAGRREGLR